MSRPAIAEAIAEAMRDRWGEEPDLLAWAPGRINLIGEHTDYNQGLSLPAAIDRWIALAIRERSDDQIRVWSVDFDSLYEGSLSALTEAGESWQRYARGVLTLFREEHGLTGGVDVCLGGDLPHGAGLSSSAALLSAWVVGLEALQGRSLSLVQRAQLCQEVEHRFLGVQCGLLDPLASLGGREGQVLQIDFRGPSCRWFPARLEGYVWLIVHSGVRRELAGSAYAQRVAECAEGLEVLAAEGHYHGDAQSLSPEVLTGRSELWAQRWRHVLSENQRVREFTSALQSGEAERMGGLLLASHASLRDDYEVSCEELDQLVSWAEADPRCAGARMMGGGFGGCSLHLVESRSAEDYEAELMRRYAARYPHPARAFRFRMVGGAAAERLEQR